VVVSLVSLIGTQSTTSINFNLTIVQRSSEPIGSLRHFIFALLAFVVRSPGSRSYEKADISNINECSDDV
jgi:hypothetical protein